MLVCLIGPASVCHICVGYLYVRCFFFVCVCVCVCVFCFCLLGFCFLVLCTMHEMVALYRPYLITSFA